MRGQRARVSKYKQADSFFMVNTDDPDLIPIKITLPKPPKTRKSIDGYGDDIEDQVFKRAVMPEKLVKLERTIVNNLKIKTEKNINDRASPQKMIDGMWEEINKHQDFYKDEIEFIKKQWHYRLYGYWFYCNGKPTYIDPWHYMYLTWWYMEDVSGKYPEYRDRDRRKFLFRRYLHTATESFKDLDEDGMAVPNEDGEYEMEEMGRLVFMGVIEPKHRRDGVTSQCLCSLYEIVCAQRGGDGGIQSFNEDNAEDHFDKKLIPAWQKYPFFFKPIWNGSNAPKNELEQISPKSRPFGKALNNRIGHASTSKRSYYDGKKLKGALLDEGGKTLGENVLERWGVVRHVLSQGDGSNIEGFSFHPSTVADMESGGGQPYYDMHMQSNFYQRKASVGQTISGLATFFITAADGLEGFIGKFGESVMDKPTQKQKRAIRREHGSKHHLEAARAMLLKKGDEQSLVAYRQAIEQFPLKIEECFRMGGGDIGWDIEKIDKRISEIKRNPKAIQNKSARGNFMWENNVRDSRVVFRHDPKGKFVVNELYEPISNQRRSEVIYDRIKKVEKRVWAPVNPEKFTAGGDPYKFDTTAEKKKRSRHGRSMGGFNVFLNRDHYRDSGDDIGLWTTYKNILTYKYRPASKDDYAEDCLMACVWYGAMIFPEINVPLLWDHFHARGYGGYLKYAIDEKTGKKLDKPGVYNLEKSKQEGFMLLSDYVNFHLEKETSLDFLQELKEIKAIDEMTKYDLIASVMCSLLGARSYYGEAQKQFQDDVIDISGIDIFQTY